MSADLYLNYLSEDEYSSDVEVGNYNFTYNLTPMFAEVSGGYGLSAWCDKQNGKKASEILEEAETILKKLKKNPQLEKLNPPNGWGSYVGMVKEWQTFVVDLKGHPNSVFDSWC